MYIEPNADLFILKNVPLDATYDHTIYWADNEQQAQYDYFHSKIKHTLTKQSYIRENKGVIKVQVQTGRLFDCNYMMFANVYYDETTLQTYRTKWFYAFITKVEYVNNKTSKIHFQIDVMQTWHFDYELEQCYVDRQHTVSDEVGEHLVPENLTTGEDTVIAFEKDISLNDMSVCALVPTDFHPTQLDSPEGKAIRNRVYSGYEIYSEPLMIEHDGTMQFNGSGIGWMIQEHSTVGKFGGNVDQLFQCPTKFVTGTPFHYDFDGGMHWDTYEEVISDINVLRNQRLDQEYQPKNKKLLTYPFAFINISNNVGEQKLLKYELFDDDEHIRFKLYGTAAPVPQSCVVPMDYRSYDEDYTSRCCLNQFPLCAWSSDSFKAWLGQNLLPMTLNAGVQLAGIALTGGMSAMTTPLGTIGGSVAQWAAIGASNIGTLASGASGEGYGSVVKSAANGLMSGAGTAADLLTSIYQAATVPDEVHGNVSYQSLTAGLEKVGYTVRFMSAKKEFLEIADNYMTRFGYKICDNIIPNRNARRKWTFLKTANCTIKASFQQDDVDAIISIYNNGITFWNSSNLLNDGTNTIGDYSQDNSPYPTTS